jgi:hypothetical protein
MKGYTKTQSGNLMYDNRTLCDALGYEVFGFGTPSSYAEAAQMAAKDGNAEHAANLYLAAALVSAGMSRTVAYEDAARAIAP